MWWLWLRGCMGEPDTQPRPDPAPLVTEVDVDLVTLLAELTDRDSAARAAVIP